MEIHCHPIGLSNDDARSEHEAIIDIRRVSVLRGSLPRGAQALTLMWAGLHRDELLENWNLCATRHTPNKIAPME